MQERKFRRLTIIFTFLKSRLLRLASYLYSFVKGLANQLLRKFGYSHLIAKILILHALASLDALFRNFFRLIDKKISDERHNSWAEQSLGKQLAFKFIDVHTIHSVLEVYDVVLREEVLNLKC